MIKLIKEGKIKCPSGKKVCDCFKLKYDIKDNQTKKILDYIKDVV
jgi:hypothetical protein